MLLKNPRLSPEHLLNEPVHDFDAGEISLVNCSIERLTCERLLMNASIRMAIEITAVPILQFLNHVGSARHQRPHQFLIVEEAPCGDRVLEMTLNRIGRIQHRIESSLDEPGTSTLSEKGLDHNRDIEFRRHIVRVDRREQT